MISISVDSDFVGEGVSWIDNEIKYIGDRSKKALKEIATLIKSDNTENILQSRSINGGQVARNLPSTIKHKGFNRPLFETGELSRSVLMRSITGGYEIFVGDNRKEIAGYLQFGTRNMTPRPFFGIRQELDNDIDSILGNIIAR